MSREDRVSEATGIQKGLALDPGLRRGDVAHAWDGYHDPRGSPCKYRPVTTLKASEVRVPGLPSGLT